MRISSLILLPVVLGLNAGAAGVADDALAKLKPIVGNLCVAIQSAAELQPASNNRPPFKSESWTFDCGAAQPAIHYTRFLNRPPDYSGQHPSLTSGDEGIGFGNRKLGDAFVNWYPGNAIRVLVNGADIATQQTASRIESVSSEEWGHLRMTWDLADGSKLGLTFTVPADGHAIYAKIDLAPTVPTNTPSLAVELQCFPGGFGPFSKHPSHRTVRTVVGVADVPRGFAGKEYPRLPIAEGQSWVFYEDQFAPSGSLGLVFPPEERASGSVALTGYQQSTALRYPAGTVLCRLAFLAFDTDNAYALRAFRAGVEQELRALKEMPFWTK